MTPLAEILIRRIVATGPITLADYMAECLLHPKYGYYTTRDPFGAAGDFTTAPEISQMFGEVLGLCLAQCWIDQGAPAPFTLSELGPGRGTLMADILRATARVPGFRAAAKVVLVEASPTLRAVQAKTLGRETVHGSLWIEAAGDLPEQPLFLVANEFFDALPIRQFQRDIAGWRERLVGVQAGQLNLGLSDPVMSPVLAHRLADTSPGDIVEICPAAAPLMVELASRIGRYGGLALVVDYGGWGSLGDTFQALWQHGWIDPLARPGDTDLTAHVDFAALARSAQAVSHSALIPQGLLLERLGITSRAAALARNLRGAQLENHVLAHRRLTHPAEMGNLFQTLAFYPKESPVPPGFHP